MGNTGEMRPDRGSVSIYLALVFPVLILLLLTLLEAARYGGLRLAARDAGNAAADSVMAGYNRTLFNEYGLLFYDGSFGGGLMDYAAVEAEFSEYFAENVSVRGSVKNGAFLYAGLQKAELADAVFATDYNGEVFIRNVLDYFKYGAVGDLLETVEAQLSKIQEGDQAKRGAESDKSTLLNQDWNAGLTGSRDAVIRRARMEQDPVSGGSGPAAPGEERVPIDQARLHDEIGNSIIGKADEAKAKGFLQLVVPSGRKVSEKTFETGDLPSFSAVDKREMTGGSALDGAVEKVLFNEYILSNYTHFLDEQEEGLRYQVEYVLFGQDSDLKNLDSAVNRILWIREGMNLLYLISSDKRSAAKGLASTMVGWTGNAIIVELTTVALLAAWAYAESILDARALLNGKKVDFFKTDKTWTLSIEGLEYIFEGNGVESRPSDTGLGYEDYLRLLLYMTNIHDCAYRTMDLIQAKMNLKYPDFLMASQIYAVEFKCRITAVPLFATLPVFRKYLGSRGIYSWTDCFSTVY